MRFPTAVARDPAVDAWMRGHAGELGAIARRWFEVMRACGTDVRELGATLPDPDRLLEGSGKFMRHVKLRPERAANAAALTQLVEAAYADMKGRLAKTP
jgi:hypothetical protein